MITKEQLARMGYGTDGMPIPKVPETTITEMRENVLQSFCERYLTDKNIYWIHLKNPRMNRKGIPDLIICIKGKAVFVELKTQTKLKPDQMIERGKIITSGGLYYIITTQRDFKELIEELSK